jgi:outer membrane murein-binding lipoprotein Lpp
MQKNNRIVMSLAAALLFSGSLLVTGCSSSPSEEQLAQLQSLKDEVASLQKEVDAKERDKASLTQSVAEKEAQLKKCNDDQQVVRKRLGQ